MVISVGGSSMRARSSRMMRPATRPMTTPPTPLSTKRRPASPSENVPLTAAATATV